jgi:hypothetical protein
MMYNILLIIGVFILGLANLVMDKKITKSDYLIIWFLLMVYMIWYNLLRYGVI